MTAQPIEPALFDFLRELKANNERPWFEANKARYRAEVRDPMLDFIEAFAEPLDGDQPALSRRSQAQRRLALPHLSGHAVLEGQDALQDQCRRALPPRSGQGRPRARLLSASGARHVLRRLRRLASGQHRAREGSRRGRGTAGGMDGDHRVRRLLRDVPVGGRGAQAPAARLRPRASPDRRPQAQGLRGDYRHHRGDPARLSRPLRGDRPRRWRVDFLCRAVGVPF